MVRKNQGNDAKNAQIENLKKTIKNQEKIISKYKKNVKKCDACVQTDLIEDECITTEGYYSELIQNQQNNINKLKKKIYLLENNNEINYSKKKIELEVNIGDLKQKIKTLNNEIIEHQCLINNYNIVINQLKDDIQTFKNKFKKIDNENKELKKGNRRLREDLRMSLSKCRYAWQLMSDSYPNIYNDYLVQQYPNEYVYNDYKSTFDYNNVNLQPELQNMDTYNIWNSQLIKI